MAPNKAELMMEALMAFNRKERYHVLRHAVLGGPMTLSDRFRQDLERVLGWESSTIPDNAYVAMDYHLDWISSAYQLAGRGSGIKSTSTKEFANYPNKKSKPVISGNQEDTDLMVAFPEGERVVLIFIEAKADTPWKLDQIQSKGKRLKSVFGKYADSKKLVKPKLVLLGPTETDFSREKLKKDCPSWFFVNSTVPSLSMSPSRELYKPTRTHKEKNGDYLKWKLERSRNFEPDKDEAE